MAKMRAVRVRKPKDHLNSYEREIPRPGPGDVRIRVQACGVCHSDSLTEEGLFPDIAYPRVPGHEVAGVLDAIGDGVKGLEGRRSRRCRLVRRALRILRFLPSRKFRPVLVDRQVTGISSDGGYAEYMIAHAVALAVIPDDVSPVDAGPLMCAGVTTFNSLRNSGVGPGEVVAVYGIGGLDIWACSSRRRAAARRWRSRAARTKRNWRRSLERTFTLIATSRTLQRSC